MNNKSPEVITTDQPANSHNKWDILAQDEIMDQTWRPISVAEALQEDGITNEKFEHYFIDHSESNRELLKLTAPENLLQTYENLITEYPELKAIRLVDRVLARGEGGEGNGRFSPFEVDEDGNAYPTISFDFSHPEKYSLRQEDITSRRIQRLTPYYELTKKIGIGPEENRGNLTLTTTEALAHEFGHAFDFIENYLAPEYQAEHDDTNLHPGVRAVARWVVAENEAQSNSLGGKAVNEKGIRFSHRANIFGADTPEERNYLNARLYMSNPLEAPANDFALNYVLGHQTEIFGSEIRPHTEWERYDAISEPQDFIAETPRQLMSTLGLKNKTIVATKEHFLGDPKTAPITDILSSNIQTPILIGTVDLLQSRDYQDNLTLNLSDQRNRDWVRGPISSLEVPTFQRGFSHFLGNYEIIPITDKEQDLLTS